MEFESIYLVTSDMYPKEPVFACRSRGAALMVAGALYKSPEEHIKEVPLVFAAQRRAEDAEDR